MQHQSQSHSERAQSLSVSPKTRVPSLQSNPDPLAAVAAAAAVAEAARHPPPQAMVIDTERAATPAKRKLGDRDLSPQELERKETRPPPGETNGGHVPSQNRRSQPSSSPAIPVRKKRQVRRELPPWAQNIRSLGNKLPAHPSFVLQKRVHSHINGKPESKPESKTETKPESMPEGGPRQSRHASPEVARPYGSQAQIAPPAEPGPQDILGPWEPSITGVKPYEELSKQVADFLFIHVINNEDMQEITSRGIQFEIEAKLGTLIDKDTNHRVDRWLSSECILQDSARVAFRSSMSEVGFLQHPHTRNFTCSP